jgi:hypothetical protein
MDPDLGRFEVVWAAAGTGTAVFSVPPGTLRTLANAMVAPVSEERRAADIAAETAERDSRDGGLGGQVTPQGAGA